MKNPFLVKLATIILLSLLLLIPIGFIHGVVNERENIKEGVLMDIAKSASGRQKISGPFLIVPYNKLERTWQEDPTTHARKDYAVSVKKAHLVFLPEQLIINGDIKTQIRNRGIYEARVFHGQIPVSGQFKIPEHYGIHEDLQDYTFEAPFIALGIEDVRGIEGSLTLQWRGQPLAFEAGANLNILGSGVHVPIPEATITPSSPLEFQFNLALAGTESIGFAQVGRQTTIQLKSSWPHPSFTGEFLPTQRTVTDKGFEAAWQTTFFSTNFPEILDQCLIFKDCNAFSSRQLAVEFIDPVNHYLKTERALKYALLFIALTFASFFMLEILKSQQLHPVQYAFVGLALALFYLLLISLSEHLGFFKAYMTSAVACVALIGFYVAHILRNKRQGIFFTLGISLLYLLLYGLLSSEDYALLMGTLLLFSLLAAVMLMTRQLNWYQITQPPAKPVV